MDYSDEIELKTEDDIEMHDYDPDTLIECPFNKHHKIRRVRMPYHLVKCKKQYPMSTKVVCPYDATEYIEAEDFYDHFMVCKSRIKFDEHRFVGMRTLASEERGALEPAPLVIDGEVLRLSAECWDSCCLNTNNNSCTKLKPTLGQLALKRYVKENFGSSYAQDVLESEEDLLECGLGRGQLRRVSQHDTASKSGGQKMHYPIGLGRGLSNHKSETKPTQNEVFDNRKGDSQDFVMENGSSINALEVEQGQYFRESGFGRGIIDTFYPQCSTSRPGELKVMKFALGRGVRLHEFLKHHSKQEYHCSGEQWAHYNVMGNDTPKHELEEMKTSLNPIISNSLELGLVAAINDCESEPQHSREPHFATPKPGDSKPIRSVGRGLLHLHYLNSLKERGE